MADEQKTIVFKVDLDNEDFIAAAAQTRRNVEQLKEEQKQLDRSTEEGARQYERYEAVIKQTQMEMRRLTDLQKAKIQFNKAEEGSNTKLRSALKILSASYNELSKEQRDNTEEGRKLGEQIAAITAELKANESAVGDNRRNVGNYKESIIEASNELKTASAFTDKNTKANLELSSQMERSARSATAIAGAFALLTNVVGDNEKAQDTLRKITIAVTAATVLSNIAKEKGAILDTIAFVKTKALTIAQTAYNAVLSGGTVAANLFRAALVAIPIAGIIAGITVLVSRLRSQKEATEEQTDAQADLNVELEKSTELYQAIADQIEGAEGGYLQEIGALERLIKLREAQNVSDLELIGLREQLLRLQIRQTEEIYNTALANDALRLPQTIALQEKQKDLETDLAILLIEKNALLREQQIETDSLNQSLREQGVAVDTIATNYERLAQILIGLAQDTYPAIKGQSKETADANTKITNDALQEQNELQQKFLETAAIAQDASIQLGQIFAESITDAGFQTEQFFRRLTVLTIDILQRQLLTAIAEIYFREVASKGFAGIATGAALTALITGASEAAKAALSKPVKFEHGGEYDPFGVDVGGKLHSQGGTKYRGDDGNTIELERGEKIFVASRKTAAIVRAVAGLNQLMGGRGLSGSSSFLADGGFASRQISDSVNAQFQSAQLAADIVRNLPEFRVSVTELNRVNNGVSNVKAVSTL